MRHDSRAYLWGVRQAADAVREFVEGMNPTTYVDSEVIHAAVQRAFQIIGEA